MDTFEVVIPYWDRLSVLVFLFSLRSWLESNLRFFNILFRCRFQIIGDSFKPCVCLFPFQDWGFLSCKVLVLELNHSSGMKGYGAVLICIPCAYFLKLGANLLFKVSSYLISFLRNVIWCTLKFTNMTKSGYIDCLWICNFRPYSWIREQVTRHFCSSPLYDLENGTVRLLSVSIITCNTTSAKSG